MERPILRVENSTKFACSERVSPDGRRVKVGITRAGLTILEFVRHEGAAEIRTRVLLSPEAVYNMLLCMGDAQKLSVLFCDSKPVPVVKKRKKAKR